jgi:hypothetical protein
MIRVAHILPLLSNGSEKVPMVDSTYLDRFYDDFDLKFDFIAKDSLKSFLLLFAKMGFASKNLV